MSGTTYGDSHYLRMNIACPISKLQEGLKRMEYGIRFVRYVEFTRIKNYFITTRA
jgi:bifunctional pyridoxal-dependent enzyme with beta-cystathionase and maltose regulon repressor activities